MEQFLMVIPRPEKSTEKYLLIPTLEPYQKYGFTLSTVTLPIPEIRSRSPMDLKPPLH
jgi:hypothetical protein